MSAEFSGQRVVIVGGTAGIGAAVARMAAASGADVLAVGRAQIDIRAEQSIRDFLAATGAMDHLVVTAATVHPGPFKTGDTEAARKSMEGKFWGQYFCARYAQVERSILLFSGTFSRRPIAGMSSLAAANGAVEALGRALAVELAPVRVNVVSPGLVQGTAAYAGMSDATRETMFANAAAHLPARVVGDPDSVASLALALLASPYVTGTVIDVDGGGLLA